MKVVVFGANGRVGALVTAELLRRGHHVIAFVHGKTQLNAHPELTVSHGDIYEERSVAEALSDADAIVSALGSWGTERKNVLTEAMQSIIPIAEVLNINRLISLTGADARVALDELNVLHKLTRRLFSMLAGEVLRDGEAHIRLLSESTLDWTVVRSPVMKSKGRHSYVLDKSRPRPWQTIPRAAVVQSLCDLVESSGHVKAAPFIHRT